MSLRSTSSTVSHTSSSSSSTSMASATATHQLAHPFLTPGRASTISSWTSSLPGRNSSSPSSSKLDAQSREAAIEAYQQLKMAMFSKAGTSNIPSTG
ncbi:hypothetical protein EJ02DRAFT_175634 [Clathrospora elynae]|uniref:Uncharacterized protein n=1 Tax=Clathrospora elynae TaxID=706981 RepID=A0A6A5SNV4_9PLEO|nr:hypothetical protein EJ02DRAFT_175634 [Clathrospora elynae]